MFATSLVAPILALAAVTAPAEPRALVAPAPATTGIVSTITRLPGFGAAARLYLDSPIKPTLGYGARPAKHIRLGVSIRF